MDLSNRIKELIAEKAPKCSHDIERSRITVEKGKLHIHLDGAIHPLWKKGHAAIAQTADNLGIKDVVLSNAQNHDEPVLDESVIRFKPKTILNFNQTTRFLS